MAAQPVAPPPTPEPIQPFPFRKLPGEIRNKIYCLLLPYQIRQPIRFGVDSAFNSVTSSDTNGWVGFPPYKLNEGETSDWANVPCDSLAILRVDRLMCYEAKACMYSPNTNFTVTIATLGFIFFNRITPMTDFLPFPSIWQFTRHWTIDLRFHRFQTTQQTLWGRDCNNRTGEIYDRRHPSNSYDYLHMMESFISVCIELAKIPQLETLTIKFPCLGCQTGDADKWINKTYVSVLAHMQAAAVKPGKLVILLTPPLRRRPQCQDERCLDYASALEEVWRTWGNPTGYNRVTKQWLKIRKSAMMHTSSSPEVQSLLYDIWRLIYFGDLTEEEKLKFMKPLQDGQVDWVGKKEQAALKMRVEKYSSLPWQRQTSMSLLRRR
ncbi:MAG: hypothetical protein Q9207_003958 [Kuettlingeria erythrocarpa]